MAAKRKRRKNPPLIFADTNILLDFYGSHTDAGLGLLAKTDSLHDSIKTGFKISAVNGSSTPDDLENAKRKMLRLVREDRRLIVSAAEAEGFIDELFKTFLERQGQHTIYQERIKQGLRARPIPSKETITKTTHPLKTQWAIAKMLYEVSDTMLPGRLRRIPAPAHRPPQICASPAPRSGAGDCRFT